MDLPAISLSTLKLCTLDVHRVVGLPWSIIARPLDVSQLTALSLVRAPSSGLILKCCVTSSHEVSYAAGEASCSTKLRGPGRSCRSCARAGSAPCTGFILVLLRALTSGVLSDRRAAWIASTRHTLGQSRGHQARLYSSQADERGKAGGSHTQRVAVAFRTALMHSVPRVSSITQACCLLEQTLTVHASVQ